MGGSGPAAFAELRNCFLLQACAHYNEGNDVLNATGTVSEFDGGPGTDTCTYNGDQVTDGAQIGNAGERCE